MSGWAPKRVYLRSGARHSSVSSTEPLHLIPTSTAFDSPAPAGTQSPDEASTGCGAPERANWDQYSPEARQAFDKYTLQTKARHGWSKGHSAYNHATREQADRFCRERDIEPSEMTESQANDLLPSILDSNDPRIHDFLSSGLQTPPFAPNQSGFFVPGELTPWGLFILGLTYAPGAH